MQFFEQLYLHPMLVHFPIALFTSALILELMSRLLNKELFHQAAVTVYVLAVCLTPLAVLTGLRQEDELHLKHPILEIHERFALITLWGSLASLPAFWFIHKCSTKVFKNIFLAVLFVVVVCVSVTAYNGGRMVYEYGIGVAQ